ncbi:MAG: trypsin-like peptidase domain-containing protein [Planctomycetes bacterium]|nr:trypsin-like peptidase domain-containing protein [Planctomycetota bacterium]
MRKMRTLVTLFLISLAARAQEGALSLEQLKSFEERLAKLTEKVVPATVGLRIGAAGGSGVIVTKDGYVLTAAHVFGRPGLNVTMTLYDGRIVEGKTLGRMADDDYGLVKLDGNGPWPFVEMGHSRSLKKGQLCIATGHPGGVEPGRSAPLRLGTILSTRGQWVRTDAIVDRGDSGGPLLDLEGRVIGIHSRIGSRTTQNMHIPVDHYRREWKRLVASEDWADPATARWHDGPVLGVRGLPRRGRSGSRLESVYDGLPAQKAGLEPDDYVVGIDGVKVDGWQDLSDEIQKKKADQEVEIEIRRGSRSLKFLITLASRPKRAQRQRSQPAGEMPVVEDDDPGDISFVGRDDIDKAFAPVSKDVDDSVVLVESGTRKKVLGTVLTKDGWIVSKLSEIEGEEITCTFEDGEELAATVASKNTEYDLAFLKVDAKGLIPIRLADQTAWKRGQWVVAAGRDDEPINVGVVSVLPRRLNYRGYLGIRPEAHPDGVKISEVVRDTAAAEAKLKNGDVITEVNGVRVKNPEDFRAQMASKDPGTRVRFSVRRGDERLKLEATLRLRPEDVRSAAGSQRDSGRNSRNNGRRSWGGRRSFGGSRLSAKRAGFKTVVQHDVVMNAADCGGPLLNASGQCIAINIARAARYCTYAVPAPLVKTLLDEIRNK